MSASSNSEERLREVKFEHSRDFVEILRQTGVSLIVSTYQAGKVVVLGTDRRGLALSFHNFEQAMGCAASPDTLAIGSKTQIWFLRRAQAVVSQLPAARQFDACYLARSSHVTDSIDIHEMDWCDDELWFVNTRFSCLSTLDDDFSFVPRWRPPWITELAPEDRCHLNGLCCVDGLPRYVTAMSETDSAEGWRPVKASGGCIIDVQAGETISRGFAMPHSPRVHEGRLWALDSGRGGLSMVDAETGQVECVTQQPGYTRGLAFSGPFAFVGLSKIRETATFGGVPIAENRDQLKCAVVVIDLRTGSRAAYFEFLVGVEEIFDVRIFPAASNPYVYGPAGHVEADKPIWYAPAASSIPSRLAALPLGSESQAASPNVVPGEAQSHFQQGNALADNDCFEQAQEHFERAISLCPDFADAYCNLGLAQQYQGELDSAIQSLEQAISLAPEFAAAHINLATTRFLAGDLSSGWTEYEWRWKCARFKKRPRAATEIAPVWDAAPLAGRSLLVYGEQGIGDEVMFASCIPELLEQAARVVIACEPRLVPLFRRSFPGATVCSMETLSNRDTRAQIGVVDFQIAAGSVPQFIRRVPSAFPQQNGYLCADENKVRGWRERWDVPGPAMNIGISWKGGAIAEEQRRRSSRLEDWKALFELPNARFVNLQYGECAEELLRVQSTLGVSIECWPDVDPLRDMDAFAAQIAALDLVVTIDNSTLHFAGALGVPTFGLVSFPSSSYWRWFGGGEETLWYPSVRLIRRRYPDRWPPLVARVANRVAKQAGWPPRAS